MERKIKLNGKEITYLLKKSRRARRLRLTVSPSIGLVATLPAGKNENLAERFIRAKSEWILDKLSYFRERPTVKTLLGSMTRSEYLGKKKEALAFIQERLAHFNALYKFKFQRISVRMSRTRWGSCSRKGNLNFNYKLLFLPRELADYVIVHELCHLREFNHSKRFWDLVLRAIPDPKTLARQIRKI